MPVDTITCRYHVVTSGYHVVTSGYHVVTSEYRVVASGYHAYKGTPVVTIQVVTQYLSRLLPRNSKYTLDKGVAK